MLLHNSPVGFLVLSHSLPNYFHDNHIRVLKILGSLIAHLRLLHQGGHKMPPLKPQPSQISESPVKSDVYSVVLMEFDIQDAYGRWVPLHKEAVRDIRARLNGVLEPKESVFFYEEKELLIFMPGVSSGLLPARIRVLRDTFRCWQIDRLEDPREVRMNLGFSVCEGEEDFSRTLEVASLVMHAETDEEPDPSAES